MSPQTTPAARTHRRARVLIVEDEALIALTLEELLIDAGFDVVGVAGRLDAALAIIERDICDAAILDTNLAGVSAGPAATALRARGVPFIVVSGYLPAQQPPAFSGALSLRKPCGPEQLVQALHSLLPEIVG
jgi:DNA-binding response OmpR family regulator